MQCPACHRSEFAIFHRVANAPVHSVLLLDTREEALTFPLGQIDLAHCHHCGFIWNTAFEPTRHDYGERYEPTQAHSPTFNRFHERLVDDLIGRFDVHNQRIVEIGCGDGSFLHLICKRGQNHGVGFDPAYPPAAPDTLEDGAITFVRDFYTEQYAHVSADFFACKMTLEHIGDVSTFVGNVRRAIGEQPNAIVFFQVPAIERILNEAAFWDIYYEHCSYFSLGSLARLFRREKFDVIDLWRDYGDQYLMVAARPANAVTKPTLADEADLQVIAQQVEVAASHMAQRIKQWRSHIQTCAARGETIVLWGGGSKGVAFLTTLGVKAEISHVVDINPRKAHTFMAGTGQEIVSPAHLVEIRPNRVIIMNPIYREEITAMLNELGLEPVIETVTDELNVNP